MLQRTHSSNYNNTNNRQLKSELDRKVDDSIETFLRTLSPIGPELMAGCLSLSFYERKAKNKLFGLVQQEEKVVWEQWILRVVVNNTPRPMGGDEASVIERQRIQVSWFVLNAEKVRLCNIYLKTTQCCACVNLTGYCRGHAESRFVQSIWTCRKCNWSYSICNGELFPVMIEWCSWWIVRYLLFFSHICTKYDFDISNTKKPDDRDEVYSRVSNMPALINLGS